MHKYSVMSNCTSTYLIAFLVFIIAAVIFHFYFVAPFLIGLFRGQQEGELLALIANNPRQKRALESSFPVSKESTTANTTTGSDSPDGNFGEAVKSRSGDLVKPLESVLSFFENRRKPVTPS